MLRRRQRRHAAISRLTSSSWGDRRLDMHTESVCQPAPVATGRERHPPPTSGEPLNIELGKRLRRIRIERGLSRQVIAACLGLPLKRIVAHERGKRRMTARDLVAYAEFYGVRLSTFFRDLSWDRRA